MDKINDNLIIQNVSPFDAAPPNKIILKADSEASKKNLRQEDARILRDRQLSDGPTVHLPDMKTIRSHEKGSLDISVLSSTANERFGLKN